MDAIFEVGSKQEWIYIRNVIGSSDDWVRDHISEMANAPKSIKIYPLTVERVKKEIRIVLSRFGIRPDWMNELDISMVRTYNRIRDEREERK